MPQLLSPLADTGASKASVPDHGPIALFDLDGTLVDSVPDIAMQINRVLGERALAPLALSEARSFLGHGLHAFAERAFAARGATPAPDDVARFIDRYSANPVVESRAYPGAIDTLAQLARTGWTMAVCTNKVEAAAVRMLDTLGMLGFFRVVCGGDQVSAQKPDPIHLRAALERAGHASDHAVMIGDHRADIEAARALGIPSIFAAWGYSDIHTGRDADSSAASFCDVWTILQSI
ncbi:HAD-IA family hydrolase [Dyella sp.]|uniref:HAD family hydrolase n=1 Tax=Dyella sp. TaxID=1869338 RepID=UPI002ED2C78A